MGLNGTLARRWFTEVWAQGGEKTVDELLAPHGAGWMEGGYVNGPVEFKAARQALLTVFPDLAVTIDDIAEDGDTAVVRWSASATHTGLGLGLQPTNRRVAFRGMTWLEFENGLVVRGWDSWNLGGLMTSLSSPEGASAA